MFGEHLSERSGNGAWAHGTRQGPRRARDRLAVTGVDLDLLKHDEPHVFEDPHAIHFVGGRWRRILGSRVLDALFSRVLVRKLIPITTQHLTRARFAEDCLEEAARNGVTQYVILGSGFDTFAFRRPDLGLTVFEVDLAATIDLKRDRLAGANMTCPDSLHFVPEVSHAGDTVRIDRFDLWFQPFRREVPIYLSALFPKMTELCGEIADGVILARSTLADAARARAHVVAGAARAGRDAAAIEIASLLPASVAPDREAALAVARPGLAFYAGFFPRYNRLLAESGFPAEAAAVAQAWAAGDSAGAARAVTDEYCGVAGHCGWLSRESMDFVEHYAAWLRSPITDAPGRW